MLNQATADNIRNINTHSTRHPAQVYDPIERKARLAAQVDNLCKHYGITQASEINAWVAMAIDVLQQNSAATAYDKTRKAIERALLLRAMLPSGHKRVTEQAHWARHAAEQRFIAKHQAAAGRRKWMRSRHTANKCWQKRWALKTKTLQKPVQTMNKLRMTPATATPGRIRWKRLASKSPF